MGWLVKPQKIYLDLVVSQLRSGIVKLSHVLVTIEGMHDYHDDYIKETLKTVETEIKRIRKFIDAN